MRADEGKFYARASARLRRALGERPTREQVRRHHEDAEAAFSRGQAGAHEWMGGPDEAWAGDYDREYEREAPPRFGAWHTHATRYEEGRPPPDAAYGGYGHRIGDPDAPYRGRR
ncbi:MAG: hypothetical protein HYV09_38910 [Deltaproteobacteria bacterium]|nr:hypothetical protein [Deltaproteobacteria bacterium]